MTPGTVAHQAPLSVEFSRQEYWSGEPFPSPGDLFDPGLNPGLPYCRQTLYQLKHQGSLYQLASTTKSEIERKGSGNRLLPRSHDR